MLQHKTLERRTAMRHIRILRTSSYKEDGMEESRFYRYFKSIIHLFQDCYWITDADLLEPYDELLDIMEQFEINNRDFYKENSYDEYKYDEYKDEYRLYDCQFIKKYGRFVRDDWNDLLCFKGELKRFREIVDVMTSMEEREYNRNEENPISPKDLLEVQDVFKDVEVLAYFYNVDAAYWGMMSNYHELIEIVIQNVNQMKGIEVKEVDVSI